jgi:heat shock protein HtpX
VTSEETAQHLADEGRVALRLVGETKLLAAPNVAAEVLSVLPAGSLVTVRKDAGPFLEVVSQEDKFGFIADETPVEAVVWKPEVEQQARGERLRAAAAGALPARALFDRVGSALSLASAVIAGQTAAAAAVDDEPFTPAAPPTPEERVLIYDRIGQNRRNTFILVVLFVLFVGAFFTAVGVVANYFGSTSGEFDLTRTLQIAVAAALFALGIGIIMYFTASKAVIAISGAHEVTKEEEPVLYRIVENLSIGSGLPMPHVWVIEDSAPNAFATGRNPAGAHVAATRGLLDKLKKRELEAVMAHEMSHVGNYDIRLMTFIAVAVGLIALVADLMLRFTWYGSGGRSSNRDKGGGAIGMIILVMALLFIVISPIIATIIRLALSRQREYLADASGALLCRNPDALADALQKISADPEPLEVANKATAPLYITNPLKGHESMLNNLFSTHPPVQERIDLLRAM